ncbi:nicotinate phosphoribosyltransferase [Ectothiorhodospira mobilis]|uniref:Nicotinate phosphoribosyltransferase n=1 Tax=Ectothiorhodospira mobilis TaxID=195064 RepID=A0A1I4PDK4_ECTMO|nr:nicotinate phosphoribosyltransferase [Ectothiorhodospira mobilis]SFM25854.1 nicotinate phosphoribosyltransferase [Ectothiorhodospira mobilis]
MTPGSDPSTPLGPQGLALFTDLYELTMMQAYWAQDMMDTAVFSLFTRRLPPRRNYILACGLHTVLEQLQALRFEEADLAYLEGLGLFSDGFLDYLSGVRFSGEVHAVEEGTPLFANEPLLEVIAPLPEGQLIETLVMNQMHLQTVQASKAARVVEASRGRAVIDFGARRIHGLDAALKGARAFHIAGAAGTSNVLAGRLYGLPVKGTMAHSYIQAHEDEQRAFLEFTRLYPDTVLLVDTYDTLQGVDRVIRLARELGPDFRVSAIRLDSGDLGTLSRQARERLDAAGLEGVGILVSGGLDEDEVDRLLRAGAPIDGFGVGTSMGVSTDAPDLDMAYKLCEYAGRGRLKLSTGKPVLPGRKQVFRRLEDPPEAGDVIARAGETLEGEPLLQPVMADGRCLAPAPSLDALRQRAQAQVARLPQAVRDLAPADPPYPVRVSEALQAHQAAVTRDLARD